MESSEIGNWKLWKFIRLRGEMRLWCRCCEESCVTWEYANKNGESLIMWEKWEPRKSLKTCIKLLIHLHKKALVTVLWYVDTDKVWNLLENFNFCKKKNLLPTIDVCISIRKHHWFLKPSLSPPWACMCGRPLVCEGPSMDKAWLWMRNGRRIGGVVGGFYHGRAIAPCGLR